MNVKNIEPAAQLLDVSSELLKAALDSMEHTAPPLAQLRAPLVDKHHAAQLLGVSEASVNRLVAAGELTHVQVGHRVLFDVPDIDRLIRKAKRTGIQHHKPGRPKAQAMIARQVLVATAPQTPTHQPHAA